MNKFTYLVQFTLTFQVCLISSTLSLIACEKRGVSSRLAAYCYTNSTTLKELTANQIHSLDYLYKREGYSTGLGIVGSVKNTNVQFFASPVLEHSTNINGGNPNKPLELGSLTFEGNSDLLKKQGAIAGVRLGVNGRHIYGKGRYMDFLVDGSLARSVDYDLPIAQNALSACSKNNVDKHWYLDACATSARTKKDLTDSVIQTASISFARLFMTSGNSYHQASAGILRRFEKSYTQNQLLLGLDTVHANGFFSSVSFSLGETVVDMLSTKFKIDAKIGTVFFARAASLSLGYSKAANGEILGFDQDEITRFVSLNYAFAPWVTVSLGYSDTDSNIDYFDHGEPIFGVAFTPLQF